MENPLRYARFPGRAASQIDAIERNTRWFLNNHLPEYSFEQILETIGNRSTETQAKAGFLPQVEDLDLRTVLKQKNDLEP